MEEGRGEIKKIFVELFELGDFQNLKIPLATSVWCDDVTCKCSRFFDFSPELVELLCRQTAVVVVVEPLDEV